MQTKQEKYKATDKGREAQTRAVRKYEQSESGKASKALRQKRYSESEKGQEALDRARAKHEASEARKAYKREWMRKKRLAAKSTSPDSNLSE